MQESTVEKKKFRRLSQGLYSDEKGNVYIFIRDFLARHGIPDRPEAREAVYYEVRRAFPFVQVVVSDDPAPDDAES